MPMVLVLLSRVQLRQCLAQQPAGPFRVRIPPQQHALGERQLVAALPRQNMQVDVEHRLERRLAVVDDDVVAVGVQAGLAGRPGNPLTDAHQLGDRVRRCVGQVDGVALGNDQGMAARERADVEDGQVVVVLVDPDRWGLTGDDGAEDAGHPATLAAQLPTFSFAHSTMRRSRSSGETSSTRVITVQRWPNGSRIDANRSPVTKVWAGSRMVAPACSALARTALTSSQY